MIVGFGLVGGIFGTVYALFYLLIGHVWGAAIIITCTTFMASVPWLLRRTGRLALTGNLHAFILVLGFGGLSAIEGGVHGHAVAWLASVPLCALLLVNTRAGVVWCGACFAAIVVFCALEVRHISVPTLYPRRWDSTVTSAGFLGLIIFMTVIGVIFELGRKWASRRMQDALHEVSEANARLVQLSSEKDEILGIAAHDLKNPLHVIIGFAKMIQTTDRESADRVQKDAFEIIKASTHMHRLVSDLLDLHAMEEGRFPLKLDFLDLGEAAESAVESQRARAAEKRITLHYAAPKGPLLVKADFRATVQILDNFISNAVKFSRDGTQVIISVRHEGTEAVLEVRDQGPGLSAEDQTHLFQKFARLSARPTGGESSSGLGLLIVKRLVEAQGGTVSCRSQPGDGATFGIRLRAFSLDEVMNGADKEQESGGAESRTRGGAANPVGEHRPAA